LGVSKPARVTSGVVCGVAAGIGAADAMPALTAIANAAQNTLRSLRFDIVFI
jgi:hypothetical protein